MADQPGTQLQEPPFTDDTFPPVRGTSGAAFANRGYQRLTQEEDQPPYTPPQPFTSPPGYSSVARPSPQQYQQPPTSTSTQQTTVVATVQPTAPPQPVAVDENVMHLAHQRMILTVVLGILSCIINPTAFLFLCPAFIFSSLAIDQSNHGHYEIAKTYGLAVLICNVTAIVYTIVCIAVAIAVVVAIFFG